MQPIFDTHAHYDDPAFDPDRDGLLGSLNSEGVGLVLNAGADIATSETSLALAHRWSFIYAACGIHPHEAVSAPSDSLDRLIKLCSDPRCVAVGEIGLDYHYDAEYRELQLKLFDEQLGIAEQLGLPAVIHSREACADTLEMLNSHPRVRCVLHCFSGSVETMREHLRAGRMIGVGGSLTFKNARTAPAVVAALPEESLLFETDCPYLSPVPLRGRRNDSRNIRLVAETAARIRGSNADSLIKTAYNNGIEFYQLSVM